MPGSCWLKSTFKRLLDQPLRRPHPVLSQRGVRAEDDLEDVPRQGSMLVLRAWRAETGVKTPVTRCPAFQNVVGDREPLQILSEPSGMSRSHDIDCAAQSVQALDRRPDARRPDSPGVPRGGLKWKSFVRLRALRASLERCGIRERHAASAPCQKRGNGNASAARRRIESFAGIKA